MITTASSRNTRRSLGRVQKGLSGCVGLTNTSTQVLFAVPSAIQFKHVQATSTFQLALPQVFVVLNFTD